MSNTKKDYGKQIIKYLKNEGLYKPELDLIINLLNDNITIYKRVLEELDNTSILNEYNKPTPLLKTHKDLTITILKLQKELILSLPYTQLKNKAKENSEESVEDFLGKLLD